jgi:hypothetical protein
MNVFPGRSFWRHPKEVYDKSDQPWKGIFIIQSFQEAPSGRTNLFQPDAHVGVDDKKRYAVYLKHVGEQSGVNDAKYLPVSMLNPNDFSQNAFQGLFK